MRVVWMTLLVLIFCGPVLAEDFKCPAVPTDAGQAQKKAGRYFSEGSSLAEKGENVDAVDRFLCSLKMTPHPNTMQNIITLTDQTDNKAPVLQLLRKFKNRNPDHPSTPEIVEMIAKLENNQPLAGPTPEEIAAQEAAKKAEEERLAAEKAAAAPPLVDQDLLNGAAEKEKAQKTREKKYRIAGGTLIGLGGAMLGMGVGFTIGANVARNNALDQTNYTQFTYYEERATNFSIGAGVGYVLATGLLIPGIVLLVRARHPKKSAETPMSHQMDMSYSISPTGAAVGGTF